MPLAASQTEPHRTTKKQRAADAELPEWATAPAPDFEYSLTMFDELGGGIKSQDISLTRAEFEALKQHLAVMRGYATNALRRRIDA